jgi:hypothetical protein
MLAVLDFDPVLRPSGPIRPIRTLRYQALKAHVARRLEQVRADLALLEWRNEYPVRATGEQTREVGLAHRQWQGAEVVAILGPNRRSRINPAPPTSRWHSKRTATPRVVISML